MDKIESWEELLAMEKERERKRKRMLAQRGRQEFKKKSKKV